MNKLYLGAAAIVSLALLAVPSSVAMAKGTADYPANVIIDDSGNTVKIDQSGNNNNVDAYITNEEDQPIPVTGEVNARITNSPGTESFWASGHHQEDDTGGTRMAISFDLDFVFPGPNEQPSDSVPSEKIAVVEYLSCVVTQGSGTFSLSETFSFFATTGITFKSRHQLPWIETGGSFDRAHFNGPVRVYASSGNKLSVQAGVSGPSTTSCEATGYFLDAP
jgi:hypothetical protein